MTEQLSMLVSNAILDLPARCNPTLFGQLVEAARLVCRKQRTLTVDDVRAMAVERGVRIPDEPRVFGDVMELAEDAKWVRNTGTQIASRRAECHHRKITLWESLL